MNILLFDVDGVLVEDHGYRASLIATINYYSRLMGQGDAAPDPDAIEIFRAYGYTNEWDICPFAIGALIASILRAQPDLKLTPAPLDDFLAQFRSIRAGPMNYGEWVSATRDRPGRPSERAHGVLSDALAAVPALDATRDAVAAVFNMLLADPYDFANAPLTQIFQEYALGSSLFEEVYRIRPRFDIPSLLYDEDRPSLNAESRSTLLELMAGDGAWACVYTARPSLPPSDITDWLSENARAPIGFSPEAELALQIIDLSDIPMIAMGRMQWLAERVGTKVEYLTKPAPVQALAAILAAISRREARSLQSAYRLVSEGESSDTLEQLAGQPMDVWVVEDSTIGLHSVIGAIDLLRKHAIDAQLHGLGISTSGLRAEALAKLCEVIVPDVNQAIRYIADHIRAQASQPRLSELHLQPPRETSTPSV